jgi:hypothetical protein
MTDHANGSSGAYDAIAAYLRRRALRYQPRADGFLVGFGDTEDDDAPVAVSMLLAAPPTGGITLEATAPRSLERDRWVPALWTLNEWNATVRGPKAMLVRTHDGDDATARIVLQDWMPYRSDVADELVDAFLDNAVAGTCLFFGVASEGAAPAR